MGRSHAGPPRIRLHGRPDHRSGQAEAGRLPPVLPAEPSAGGGGGQGQPPPDRRRVAASHRLRGGTRRALRVLVERRRIPVHDRTGRSSPVERQIGLDEFPSRKTCGGATAPERGSTTNPANSPGSPVTRTLAARSSRYIPTRCHPAGGGGSRRAGPAPGAAGHGHGHGKNLHRLPDHLAAVETGKGQAGYCSSWIGTSSPTRP